jgi:hypothetical protein
MGPLLLVDSHNRGAIGSDRQLRGRPPARQRLLARRRAEFTQRYVAPLLSEAARLGIDTGELFALIKDAGHEREGVSL